MATATRTSMMTSTMSRWMQTSSGRIWRMPRALQRLRLPPPLPLLGGVVAAHSTLPVIGVPIDSSPLKGWDALLATVQMPPGVPVATVSVGKAGATNAAVLVIDNANNSIARLAVSR